MGNRSKRRNQNLKKSKQAMVPGTAPTAQAASLQHHVSSKFHIGPLPDPDTLRAYGDIVSDLPERIVRMAEGEQFHRHEMEDCALSAQIDDLKQDRTEARLGQVLGFLIGLVAIIGGVTVAISGAQWGGSAISGIGVIGLVTAFIKGRQHKAAGGEPAKK